MKNLSLSLLLMTLLSFSSAAFAGPVEDMKANEIFRSELNQRAARINSEATAILDLIRSSGMSNDALRAQSGYTKDTIALRDYVEKFLGKDSFEDAVLDTDMSHLSNSVPGDADIKDVAVLLKYRGFWWRQRMIDLAYKKTLEKLEAGDLTSRRALEFIK